MASRFCERQKDRSTDLVHLLSRALWVVDYLDGACLGYSSNEWRLMELAKPSDTWQRPSQDARHLGARQISFRENKCPYASRYKSRQFGVPISNLRVLGYDRPSSCADIS